MNKPEAPKMKGGSDVETCKDCIHHEACLKMLEASGFGYAYNPESSAERCDTFLNAADVVPRSECKRCGEKARETIESLQGQIANAKAEVEGYRHNWQKIHDSYTADCIEHYNRGRSEVAREIFEEIESISSDFPLYGNINTVIFSERDLAYLKKKYTEVEK